MTTTRGHLLLVASLASAGMLAGCVHMGPRTIPVDRFDYSGAIADSWKEQILLNIVKLRYMDLPVFVEVSSIVAGYSVQVGGSVGGAVSSSKSVQGNYLSAGGQVIYTDRPTITYMPLTGQKFLRGLITPIDPKNIFAMLQSGYAADFILGLTVESLNGVRNRSTGGGMVREADPEFFRVLELLRDMQAAGAVGLRVQENKATGATGVLFFRRDDLSADVAAKGAEARRLLFMPADQQQFTLTYSPVRGEPGELAVNSRSMLQIMGAFASYVDVPESHLKDHSATPTFEGPTPEGRKNPVRIHSGKDKPENVFAAVHYRGYWFWVDEEDLSTKRALTAVMFFFTLGSSEGNEQVPMITIPAQ